MHQWIGENYVISKNMLIQFSIAQQYISQLGSAILPSLNLRLSNLDGLVRISANSLHEMVSKFLKHPNLTSLNPQSLTTNELVVYIVLRYMHNKTTPRHLFQNKHHLLIPHVQLRSLIPTRHMRYCSRSWWTLRVVECHIPQGLETYGGKHCGFPFWLCKKKCNVGSYWKEKGSYMIIQFGLIKWRMAICMYCHMYIWDIIYIWLGAWGWNYKL